MTPRLRIERVPLTAIHEDPANARKHDEANLSAIRGSLSEPWGQVEPLVVQKSTGRIIGGNGRYRAMKALGWTECDIVRVDVTDIQAAALSITLNRTAELAAWDLKALSTTIQALQGHVNLEALGWKPSDLKPLLAPEAGAAAARESLAQRFLVPPFSILDARQGYWRERKAAWLALGIQSEVGRGDNLLRMSDQVRGGYEAQQPRRGKYDGGDAWGWSGTSIFDPVLCEVAYRWFCPPGGRILDPFAGGSVRGIVAASLGFHYHGIDLRQEQVQANQEQAQRILGPQGPRTAQAEPGGTSDPDALSPVQKAGPYWLKRDDLFTYAGTNGGKVRALLALIKAKGPEQRALVSWCSRESPQQERIARVAQALGLPARIHIPDGPSTPESSLGEQAGATIIRHKHGRLSVLKARAEKDVEKNGGLLIPWGMECAEAVEATRRQVANLPAEVKRIVVPTGSGVSLAGILWGLRDAGRDVPVLAVSVGAAWEERLARLGPPGAKPLSVKSPLAYEESAEQRSLEGVPLDPIYEAKCIPFLEPGDLLWCVGRRESITPAAAPSAGAVSSGTARWTTGDARDLTASPGEEQVDLVFTCPPYFDLEKYSDDPRDLSNMTWEGFLEAYATIIARAARRLRDDRFLILVVGDVRDPDGNFRGLVKESIAAGEEAGLRLYNEAVFIPPLGSLPVRAGRIFQAQRKLGKAHQNVLVFLKGDAARAAAALGPAEFGEPEPDEEDEGGEP